MPPNPFLLAADDPQGLIALLRREPSILASKQDEHGYSLIHAAASYNHLDLLRALISEFKVPVDLKDEDGETALFVVETVAAARVLVEEWKLDAAIRNNDGLTAAEKIESEADFPDVAEYLRRSSAEVSNGINGQANGVEPATDLPPVPEGWLRAMTEQDTEGQEPDPEFRRRIEELAARDDFQTPEGQAELRRIVQQAVTDQGLSEERNVRSRHA